jgi:hypothetical protein
VWPSLRVWPNVFAVVAVLLMASSAAALPRYSAQYGQRCALCHVEPTGGGLRTQYATRFLIPEEMSLTRMEPEELESIRPDLNPAVTVGLDLRSLVYQGEGGTGGQLDMQGDAYVGVQATSQFAAFIELGKGGTHEYAGLAYVLPASGYVKAGRFTPDYGWQWADHKMASREYLLVETGQESPRGLAEAGIELGMHGQTWEVTGSVLQGAGQNGESYAARLALRRSYGPVNLALGTSVIRRQLPTAHARAWGGFGYAAAGPVAWVFQVDETGNGLRNGLLISQELTYRLARGLHARGVYSFVDPDHREKTGTRNRWGLGFDSLINPFFGVQATASYHHVRPGDLVAGTDSWQGELVLHFLY